jgi:hypothetical protein
MNKKAKTKYMSAPKTCRIKLGAHQNQLDPPLKCNPAINHANTKSTKNSASIAVLDGIFMT